MPTAAAQVCHSFWPRIFAENADLVRVHPRDPRLIFFVIAELRDPGARGVTLLEDLFRFLLDRFVVFPTTATILVRLVRTRGDEQRLRHIRIARNRAAV